MTTTKSQRQQRRIPMRYVWLIVAAVAFLIPLVFEFDGLSPAGHRMFAIFLVAIVRSYPRVGGWGPESSTTRRSRLSRSTP